MANKKRKKLKGPNDGNRRLKISTETWLKMLETRAKNKFAKLKLINETNEEMENKHVNGVKQ